MRRINNIFYTLQGEGHNTGRAAAFIRFAGCNLRCSFCDTEFDSYQEMTDTQILDAISPFPTRFVVLTGGEPTLQVDEAFVDLLHQHGYEVAMESNGTRPAPQNLDWLTVSPKNWWLADGKGWMENCAHANEIKIVADEAVLSGSKLSSLRSSLLASLAKNSQLSARPKGTLRLRRTLNPQPSSSLLYLQPCDTGDSQRNADIISQCVDFIKHHPEWRLSLQTHKLIGIE